jgi:uncharacterized protein
VTLVGGTGLQLACESNLAISSVAQESQKARETLGQGRFAGLSGGAAGTGLAPPLPLSCCGSMVCGSLIDVALFGRVGYKLVMIAFLTLELRIEAAHSLKDKRQVTRSLKDRLRSSFNVAVAELDPSSLWNQATIGVVSVSHSRDYLDGLMKNVERSATRIANNAGADVTDSFVEFL